MFRISTTTANSPHQTATAIKSGRNSISDGATEEPADAALRKTANNHFIFYPCADHSALIFI